MLNRTTETNKEEFQDVAPLVTSNFYVDFDSVDCEAEAIRRCQRLSKLLACGGFRLTKWLSPNRGVLSSIDSGERMTPTLDPDLDRLQTEKTLGVHWDCDQDTLRFKIRSSSNVDTKRKILAEVASIFDPLGLLAPVVLSAKIILQRIWREELGWDDALPEKILEDWKAWSSHLTAVENLILPRCLLGTVANPTSRTLHVFTDASEAGFGAVVYLRVRNEDDVDVNFVIAKNPCGPHQVSVHPAPGATRSRCWCAFGNKHQQRTWTSSVNNNVLDGFSHCSPVGEFGKI